MKATRLLVFFLALVAHPAMAQAKDHAADRKAIEAIGASWQDAWNRHDMDALASLVAKDVDFVNVVGVRGWEKGREDFKRRHTAVHKTMFKNSVWTTKEVDVKFIRPDIAIAHVIWETKGDVVPDKKPRTPRGGIFTWVLEKKNGGWLIIASGNTENKAPIPKGGQR